MIVDPKYVVVKLNVMLNREDKEGQNVLKFPKVAKDKGFN